MLVLYHMVFTLKPAECGAIVARGRNVCVENLRKAMRAGIGNPAVPYGSYHGDRRETQES